MKANRIQLDRIKNPEAFKNFNKVTYTLDGSLIFKPNSFDYINKFKEEYGMPSNYEEFKEERDSTTMEATNDVITFRTRQSPLTHPLNLDFIREEILTFKTVSDACIYYASVIKDLTK